MEFVWLNLFLSFVMFAVCYQIAKTYGEKYEEHQTGSAPTIVGELEPLDLCSGSKMRGHIPEDLFYDPDPGDALRYFLTTVEDNKIPEWIIFDRHNLHITFAPPAGQSGELTLKLKVTDADELSCEVEFDIRWSDTLVMSDHLQEV